LELLKTPLLAQAFAPLHKFCPRNSSDACHRNVLGWASDHSAEFDTCITPIYPLLKLADQKFVIPNHKVGLIS
jgi:hypothetical protein